MRQFLLPDLGEGLEEAEIISWHVVEGDHVVVDQPLVSVETDKAVVEVPSPWSGRIAHLFGGKGDLVNLAQVTKVTPKEPHLTEKVWAKLGQSPVSDDWKDRIQQAGAVWDSRGEANSMFNEKLLAADPDDRAYRAGLARSYEKLGNARLQQGRLADALDAYRRALALREALLGDDPGDREGRHAAAFAHTRIAAPKEMPWSIRRPDRRPARRSGPAHGHGSSPRRRLRSGSATS